MAQIGDFFARLVSAGGTRGLSGDADRVLPSEPVFAFFNDRLRKHHTPDDFIVNPSLLWSTQTFLSRRGGLEAHLRAERGDGVAGFSDILVVINAHDWRRSLRLLSEPWAAVAAHRLRSQFQVYCEEHDFHRLFPQRPMGVQIIQDGGLEMGGSSLELGRGEFVTGLLPNFYAGANASSRPVIAFHLNIPGAWTGYREVGRLYSDQVLFTLGSHWLENFQHPKLQLPALYRLQQFSDGSFIHVINPEAIGDVLIKEHESNGATVLTLQHVSGVPLAHLVLAMLDETTAPVAPGDGAWTGASVVGEIMEMTPDEDAIDSPAPVVPDVFHQSRTVVPAEVGAQLLTLRERGVLLQRVHFARFMSGYDVFIGPGGEVGTALEAPSATLQVRRRSVSVVAHVPEVHLDSSVLIPGRPMRLSGNSTLKVGGTTLELVDLSTVELAQWPYLLEIRRRGNSSHLVFGRTHRMGRDPRCSVRLPDEPHNGNIIWRPEVEKSSAIRSRNGEIPKSRFYIDSIMVASEHAELDLTDTPVLRGRARDCFSFVRRHKQILAITPQRHSVGRRDLALQSGDELLIGNCVFQVGWSDGMTESGDPEREHLTAELLASVVDELHTQGGASATEPTPSHAPPPMMAHTEPPPPHAPPPMMAHTEPPPLDASPEALPAATSEPAPPLMMQTEPPSTRTESPSSVMPAKPASQPKPLGETPLDHARYTSEDPLPPTLSELVEAPSAPLNLKRPSTPESPDLEALPTVDALASDHVHPTNAPRPPGPQVPASGLPTLTDFTLGEPMATDLGDVPQHTDSSEVAVVEEQQWQLELSRPARLVTTGWMVAGHVSIGNHRSCEVVLPENRSNSTQIFEPITVARMKVRGPRGHVQLASNTGATLLQDGQPTERADSLDKVTLRVPRVDADGDLDFILELRLSTRSDLPDPRSQFLEWNSDDAMAAGLFTVGLPLNATRNIRLGPISASAKWDGTTLRLSAYLGSYKKDDQTYHPFFIRQPDGRFETAPEDGRSLSLEPGTTLICGMEWIELTRPT